MTPCQFNWPKQANYCLRNKLKI
jgi:hypothetical protein